MNKSFYQKWEIVIKGSIYAVSVFLFAMAVVFATLGWNPFQPLHYWAPGSNFAGQTGVPDGWYQQKDWGFYDNQTRVWSFAMCGHDYLGPLHGGWRVAESVSWIPITSGRYPNGVYPFDAQLWVQLENNTIVNVRIESAEYR